MPSDHPSLAEVSRTRLVGGGPIRATRLIGDGGEGWVYELSDGKALKWYKPKVMQKHSATLKNKITAMIAHPPVNPTAGLHHPTIAWPVGLVVTGNGEFRGFVMPLLDGTLSAALHQVVNPADRRAPNRELPWLAAYDDWKRLVQTAMNLAGATAAIHQAGYVIGDFNESNVLVNDRALVTIIDCDSMQVPSLSGTPYLCLVGKDEFRAPEVTDFHLPRTPEADAFALAVHCFMLLMEGKHPFAGVWNGPGEKPSRGELARRGIYFLAGDPVLTAPTRSPATALLPAELHLLFRRAFGDGAHNPRARPTAEEWRAALDQLSRGLTRCGHNHQHTHPGHLTWCPWCHLEAERAAAPVIAAPIGAYSVSGTSGWTSAQTSSAPSAGYGPPAPQYGAPTGAANPSANILSWISIGTNLACPIISIVLAAVALRRTAHVGASRTLPTVALTVGIAAQVLLCCFLGIAALTDSGQA